jgi:hypothetical protein
MPHPTGFHGPSSIRQRALDVSGGAALPTTLWRRRHGAIGLWAAVVALLGIYLTMALTAIDRQGPAFDEVDHLAAGYNIWLRHDFRLNPANGDLVKRWAAIPLLWSKPAFPPTTDPDWRSAEYFPVGWKFLFRSGNDPDALLRQGRLMVGLLAVALGLGVFVWTRHLFGPAAGLLALTLFAFCPHMLAHGALITTDLSIALMLFAAVGCIWGLLHRVTWARLIASLAVTGLLLPAKLSGILIVPIAAVMLTIRLCRNEPLRWELGRPRVLRHRSAQFWAFAALAFGHIVFAWTAVWAAYDFRYVARANAAEAGLTLQPISADVAALSTHAAGLVGAFRLWHALPEGFLYGAETELRHSRFRPAFLNSRWRAGGWRMFFPYVFLVKTSPALLLLAPLGAAAWFWRRRVPRRADEGADVPEGPIAPFYAVTPLLSLMTVYLGFAMWGDIDIGHRHLLPIYPALYVLGGAAVLWWKTQIRWVKLGLVLLPVWYVGDSLAARPNYLAYFNLFAGGADHAYQHVVDSSLDWGLGLPQVSAWLEHHNPGQRDTVFLSYFGTGDPVHYGIRAQRLPSFPDWRPMDIYPLTPGIYVISATMYQSVYGPAFGPWTARDEEAYQRTRANLDRFFNATAAERDELLKRYSPQVWQREYAAFEGFRFVRLCAWLRRNRSPDDNVGHSILIWRLDGHAINAALDGPPPEMEPVPEGLAASVPSAER